MQALIRKLGAVTAMALSFICAPAQATTCIQGPIALPWLSGPPEWDDFNGDSFWRPELHDPRWSGTPFRYLRFDPSSPTEGFSTDSAYRVLEDGNFLYVSFQVMMDDNGPNLNDFVYLAFTKGGTDGAIALRINARIGTAIGAPADPDGAGPAEVVADVDVPETVVDAAVAWWETSDANGPAAPSWTLNTGVPPWLKAARWNRVTADSPRWAITMRIDLSAVSATGDRKMFFGTNVDVTAPDDIIMANTQPLDDATIAASVGDATIIPEMSTNWEQFVTTGCTSGATIAKSDVGVFTGTPGTNPAGALTTNICAGGTCGSGENTFRAKVKGLSGGLSNWMVRTRFRIADWGSVPAYRNFGRWTEISQTPTGTNVFTAPQAQLSTANGWYWQDDGVSEAVIDYHCSKGADAYCPKLEDESATHQCMLVEVGQPVAGTQVIETPGVYKNMDYQDLSSVERKAVISIAGLKEVLKKDTERQVLLHISRRNMPAHGEKPLTLPVKAMEFAKRYTEDPPEFNRPIRGLQLPSDPAEMSARTTLRLTKEQKLAVEAWRRRAERAKKDAAVVERIGRSREQIAPGIPMHQALAMESEQLLDAVWPTYRVRVYFDDGRTFTDNGDKDRVLIPMPSFGFRFQHEGPLYGFTDAFAAEAGVQLEPVPDAPNWYRVTIPSEGKIAVNTKITAEEEPRKADEPNKPPETPGQGTEPPGTEGGEVPEVPPCRCHCRVVGNSRDGAAWWLGLSALGLFWAARRRRRAN